MEIQFNSLLYCIDNTYLSEDQSLESELDF